MKALTHVTVALAAATFVPGVLTAPAPERATGLLLAAAFGLLPDTLEALVARFEPVAATPTLEKKDSVASPRWSHSWVVACLFSLAAGVLLGEVAGWCVALALLSHLVLDALGPMGMGWAWPLAQQPSQGLNWLAPDDVALNGLGTWLAGGVVLYNLCPLTPLGLVAQPSLLFWGVLLPGLVNGIYYWERVRGLRK